MLSSMFKNSKTDISILRYNLKYANPDATDEDVFEACRAASIHDKIQTFPDGYNTKVGERGLRLSGGEKQRVCLNYPEALKFVLSSIGCYCPNDLKKSED